MGSSVTSGVLRGLIENSERADRCSSSRGHKTLTQHDTWHIYVRPPQNNAIGRAAPFTVPIPPTIIALVLLHQRDCFWVKHYAGKVKYTVHGWVERNMDSIPSSFSDTLQSSTHQARPVDGVFRIALPSMAWMLERGGYGGGAGTHYILHVAALAVRPLVARGRKNGAGGGHLSVVVRCMGKAVKCWPRISAERSTMLSRYMFVVTQLAAAIFVLARRGRYSAFRRRKGLTVSSAVVFVVLDDSSVMRNFNRWCENRPPSTARCRRKAPHGPGLRRR